MIDRLILGDNAFFGVNHRSRAEGDLLAKRFEDPREVARVCVLAKRHGAGGIMLSSHRRSPSILEAMRREPELRDFRVYPNIPYLMKYVQRSTQAGFGGILSDVFSTGPWHRRAATLARGGWAYLRRDFRAMLAVAVELELEPYRRHPLPAIFLHNGLADLALGLGWTEVFRFWDDLIRTRYRAVPGFGTLNQVAMPRALAAAGIQNPLIMAPFNAAGFHMNPSREACELSLAAGGYTLLAMNVLVSGAASPEEAFRYLGRHAGARHLVVGATSEAHLAQNELLLKKYLGL